jgi:hypothetical protein
MRSRAKPGFAIRTRKMPRRRQGASPLFVGNHIARIERIGTGTKASANEVVWQRLRRLFAGAAQ